MKWLVFAGRLSRIIVLLLLLPLTAVAQQRDARTSLPPAGTNEISVLVVSDDQNARPVRRVSVSLQAGEIVSPRTVVTDDNGRAVFRGIVAGNYVLTASRPGYVRVYYGAKTPWRGPGIAVAVFDGKPVPEIRMRLPRGGVISGVVRSPGGKPVANVTVTAIAARNLQSQNLQEMAESVQNLSITDDRGVYRIFGLAPGSYYVSVQTMGSSFREELRQVTAEQLQWADKVVSGGVASTPAPELPPTPGSSPTSSLAPTFYPGTTIANDAGAVTVEPGQERLGIDFALQLVPTAQVKGRVLDEQGRPQANASVSLRGGAAPSLLDVEALVGASLGGSRTQADGTFTLSAVRPGNYTLAVQATVRPPNEKPPTDQARVAEAMSGMFGGGGTHHASQDISVSGRDITDLTLVLRPALTVTGKVVFDATTAEAPKDLSSVRLSLSSMDSPMGGLSALMGSMLGTSVTVTADGVFTAKGLAPGKYRMSTPAETIRSLQPMEITTTETWTFGTVTLRGRDVADTGIDVKEDVSGVVVTFTDHPTEITGTVYDQAGRVTPDFPIVIFSTDRTAWVSGSRRIRQGRPSSDGRYRIVGLPAGEYFVCAVTGVEQNELNDPAFLQQLAASSFKIMLRDGQKLAQDLKLGGG